MNRLLQKYRMSFEPWGLALFAAVMLPNLLWMIFPVPNDVLRANSLTPVVDRIGSICQMAMVFCLCFIRRVDAKPLRFSPLVVAALVCAGVSGGMGLLFRGNRQPAGHSAADAGSLRGVPAVSG